MQTIDILCWVSTYFHMIGIWEIVPFSSALSQVLHFYWSEEMLLEIPLLMLQRSRLMECKIKLAKYCFNLKTSSCWLVDVYHMVSLLMTYCMNIKLWCVFGGELSAWLLIVWLFALFIMFLFMPNDSHLLSL